MRHSLTYILPLALLASCSDYTSEPIAGTDSPRIIATVSDSGKTRTMVDDYSEEGVIGVLWTDGDCLGVFDRNGSNHTSFRKQGQASEARAVFAAEVSNIVPRYAYYPYSAENNGRDITSLTGNVPPAQTMDKGNIEGDYKYGVAKYQNSDGSYIFEFEHLFSLVKVDVNASGSDLYGDKLKSVAISVSRGENPVGIAGNFTFDAREGTYQPGNDISPEVTLSWGGTPDLSAPVVGYVSMFPVIYAGDKLNFKVTTDRHIATFTVPSGVGFENGNIYLIPLALSKFCTEEYGYTLTDSNGNPEDTNAVRGTFTCATYNVDGLPSLINSDGPGSNGTTTLGRRVNSDSKWDFFCVSEDFEYDSELTAALTNYSHGTYRGSVDAGQAFGVQADTDGLNMFWKNNGSLSVSNETFVEYNDKEGGLMNGANTCIKKGFRYYLVTLKDGTEIDVYITHMNTFSGDTNDESKNKYVAAVHSQLRQVRDYMIANCKKNKRPAIFMGDTNMRYTRHKIKELFMSYIGNLDGFSVVDPWCKLAWNSDFSSVGGLVYPRYNSKSLMVSDATGTNADTDIIISEAEGGLQKGEVVDKVFYINYSGAKTRIEAKSYLRDVSYKKTDGSPLADHYPIVVEFEYTNIK